MPFGISPALFAVIIVLLLVIFAFFLLFRRTAMAFREGAERGAEGMADEMVRIFLEGALARG